MVIQSTTGTSYQGIQRGSQGMRRSAAEIAAARHMGETGKPIDVARSMVELHQHSHQIGASIKAFKGIDEAIGTLLDVTA